MKKPVRVKRRLDLHTEVLRLLRDDTLEAVLGGRRPTTNEPSGPRPTCGTLVTDCG
jgi:hypothetical protein